MPSSTRLRVLVAAAVAVAACTSTPKVEPPAGIAVVVRPSSAWTTPGTPIQLTAVVTGTSNTAVTWHLQETGTAANLSDTGLFTAPSVGTWHATARSVADSTRSATATLTVSDAALGVDVLPPARRTIWRPGIWSDGQLGLPLGDDGLPQRSDVCVNVPAGGDVQAALDGCAAGRVVQLSAGTYTVSSTITLTKGVVLRGAGSQGAPGGGTTIVMTGAGSVLSIGTAQDRTCYASSMTPHALTTDAVQEATTVTVSAASAADFHAGDLALVDAVDGPGVGSSGTSPRVGSPRRRCTATT